MQSESISKNEQDFLLLRYSKLDFIIGRNQFTTSSSIDGEGRVNTPFSYMKSYTRFDKERVLLFDFNSYLKDVYRCSEAAESRLCLIMRVEDFNKRQRQTVCKIVTASDKLSHSYIGFTVTSRAEIHSYNLDIFKKNPERVHDLLKRKGQYGCTFQSDGRIRYLIDLQRMFFVSLEKSLGSGKLRHVAG